MARKVLFYIAASLDGYIATPDGGVDWLPQPSAEEVDYGYADLLASVDTTLQGRTTYEQVLTFGEWPYPSLRNYVFTHQPPTQAVHPSIEFVTENPVDFVARLRQQEGKNIWLIGGSTLAAPLLQAGVVDELLLFVMPQLLGQGIRLWQDRPLQHQPVRLLRTHTWPDGVTLLHYQLT